MLVRFFWDFYGPHAERTALHFKEHLEEFLRKHQLSMPTGAREQAENHWSAFCDPPDVPALLRAQGAAPIRGDADEDSSTAVEGGAAPGEGIADQIGRALRPQRVEAIE